MDNPQPSNAASETPVIEMERVKIGSLRDPRLTMLEDVNWTVRAGEYWVIAGLQSSGKSDLLSTTAGLIAPQGGTYRLFGHEMPIFEGELLAERLRVGLVFDGGQLFHNLTIAENIALPLRYHKTLSAEEAAKQVNAMLELTELTSWADNTPGSVGRNLKKRAGLARALILQPEVLLLDNPLGGLDLRQVGWWLNFLGQLSAGHAILNGRPSTLVVTAEDLRPWRERGKQFAVLQDKKFIALGNRPDLAAHADPLVKELLAEDLPDI
ncbi:MAG: transporter related-protein [Pedosphaera sp.]|nr:transporter related-protein [Pedosphaera sp.]